MAVFLFAAVSWVLSARKWFNGPVKTIEEEGTVAYNNKDM